MKKVILIAGIGAIIFTGCKNEEKKEVVSEVASAVTSEAKESVDSKPTEMDLHTTESNLDWAGVYESILPCADCKGIKTLLELNKDKTYKLSQTYLGMPDGENEFKQAGEFALNVEGTKIRLRTQSGRFQFKVGENQLWLLDEKGNLIEGDLADMYIFKKTIQ